MMRERGFLQMYAFIGLIGVLVVAFAGWKGYSMGYDSAKTECLEAAEATRKAEEKKSGSASIARESDREKTRIVYRTITQSVDKIVERPVYRNQCLDADGLQLGNAALSGALTSAREPDRRVPAADAAAGRAILDGAKKAD